MAARRKQTYRQSRRNVRAEQSDLTPDQKIVREAKDRFKRAEDWESEFWRLYVMDVKFVLGDSDNGWQWPDDLRKDREVNKRPTLTVNKVAPLCRLITNDQRQNKSSVTVRPANDAASYEAAEVFEGLVRQIEYDSNAQAIYDDAGESQVEGGIGYWRVQTEFVDNDSFDQKCKIDPVPAHRNVLLDCDIKQKDGSDAEWGFIFDDIPDEEFERTYGDRAVEGAGEGLSEADTWVRDGYTRVAEYYRIKKTADELVWTEDEEGNSSTLKKSEMPPELYDQVRALEKQAPDRVRRRPIEIRQLEWFKIAGSAIIDRRELKGSYIPIVRCVGIERVVDNKLVRKGHVRSLKDQQRMYNYNSSGQVEYGALQTKSPWLVAAAAVAGYETQWNNMNRQNAAYLVYRHKDAEDKEIPPPIRNAAPGESPAFLHGMEIADRELAMASGQQDAYQGKQGNEISGKAILQRQRRGDLATYHFTDNMALALRHTGVIVINLAPQVYDTERVMQILGKDGKQQQILIKPDADKAYDKAAEDRDDVVAYFNPGVGQYKVVSDPGPSYATRRQETFNAFVQIVTGSPELINDIGDIMFDNSDFAGGDKIAERIRNKIRATQPWLLDDKEPGPVLKQLQQQNQQLQQQVGELLEKLGDEQRKLRGKDQKRDIEAYRAESDRVNKFGNTVKDLEANPQAQQKLAAAMVQVLTEIYGEDIAGDINAEQAQEGGEQPPFPGARKAPDGQWYVVDPSRKGKWARVMTEAQHAA